MTTETEASLEPQARHGGVARETETHVHGYTVTQSEAQCGAASAIELRAVEHAGSHTPEPRRPHVTLGACSVSPWAGVAAVPSELDMLGDAAAPAWGACRGLERKVGLAKVLVFDSAATQGCRFLERRDRALYVDVDPAAMR